MPATPELPSTPQATFGSARDAGKPSALPSAWVLLTTAELERLVTDLETGDQVEAVERYRRLAAVDLPTAWRQIEQLCATLGVRVAGTPENRALARGELARRSRNRVVAALVCVALSLLGLLVAASWLGQERWLDLAVPLCCFVLGSWAALRVRNEGVGSGLIVLGAVLLVGSGVGIVGLQESHPGTAAHLWATAPYFAALLLLGAGCGIAVLQTSWQSDDATATVARSESEILGIRRARPLARWSVFLTVYAAAFVLHRHIVGHEMTEALFNALFRFLLVVPLIGVMAAITAAVASDRLHKVAVLTFLPILSAVGASWLLGRGTVADAFAEMVLVQILASVVGLACIVGRSPGVEGWRRRPLLSLTMVLAMLAVPTLLIWGMASELLRAAVERGMLSSDPRSWLPFVAAVVWAGVDLGGVSSRGEIGSPAVDEL